MLFFCKKSVDISVDIFGKEPEIKKTGRIIIRPAK